MNLFGFDLVSLFKAPVVTTEPEIPDPQEDMPIEYYEIDTSVDSNVNLDISSQPVSPIPPIDNMHQRMYELSVSTPTTIELDPVILDIGGSENFLGGSENLG